MEDVAESSMFLIMVWFFSWPATILKASRSLSRVSSLEQKILSSETKEIPKDLRALCQECGREKRERQRSVYIFFYYFTVCISHWISNLKNLALWLFIFMSSKTLSPFNEQKQYLNKFCLYHYSRYSMGVCWLDEYLFVFVCVSTCIHNTIAFHFYRWCLQ